jgi:peptide/nickel transport system permease protein
MRGDTMSARNKRMEMVKQFTRNRTATVSLTFIIIVVLSAVFSPQIAPYNPEAIDLRNRFSPPDGRHLLGTDSLGRDVLSRIIYGARVSLVVGFISAAIALCIGVPLGLIAGYYGGLVDEIIMRVTDIFLTLPWLPMVLVFVTIFGNDITNILIIFGGLAWPDITRVVRPESMSLTERDFILAEKVIGASPTRILFLHLLPNQLPSILVYTTLLVGWGILGMSSVGFLGLAPITIDWGSDLSQALKYMITGSWWLVLFPGIAIFLTVLCFYLVSDAIQDLVNRRERRIR